MNILPRGKATIDQKIVVAFEMISRVLKTLAWKQGKALALNPAQTQLLIFLLQHDEEDNRVGTLAREFNVSKASISDTICSLEQRQLISKISDKDDTRSSIVRLTAEGTDAATTAALYTNELLQVVSSMPKAERQQLFSALGDIIFGLHSSGAIPVQRMCLSCKHHRQSGGQHYCQLLGRRLPIDELQVDCPEHEIL